jgi:hypothetical protein
MAAGAVEATRAHAEERRARMKTMRKGVLARDERRQ